MKTVNQLIKEIYKYEFGIILLIIKMLKWKIINEFFDNNNVQARYCYIHDQGCLMAWPKTYPSIVTLFTRTCNNYCEFDFIGNFNLYFIRNYSEIYENNYNLEYKLKDFLKKFYDYKKDKYVKTPLAIELFYNEINLK